jgi:pyruvate dehydrogenase E2 component (dihydrolipoamide acetyltransferase)
MPKLVLMPKIGVNMTEAVISQWLVKVGDRVEVGQAILSAETDKAIQEIPSTESGVVDRLLCGVGDTIQCQQPILSLAQPGEENEKPDETPLVAADGASNPPEARISPLAKKTAQKLGIDPRLVPPAKPGARITQEDVERYAQGLKAGVAVLSPSTVQPVMPSAPQAAAKPLSGIRKLIAQRMLESVTTKPTVALTLTASAEGLMAWRESSKRMGCELRYNEMLVAITAKALTAFPQLNSALIGDSIVENAHINIGVAVDAGQGVMVPTLTDADKKSVYELQAELEDRIEKVRRGTISAAELEGGSFTITNLGMFEIEQFDAIINPPQCAILAVGAIVQRPVVRNNAIAIGHEMQLTLCFDHRIVDGALAARCLQHIKHLIETPVLLLHPPLKGAL